MLKQNVHIILPSYNEELNLPNLLLKIDLLAQQSPYFNIRVYVINDGSKDNTLQVANNYNSYFHKNVIDIQPNGGLAGAMRRGFQEAIKELEDYDVIVALDADDSQNPFLIERMVKQINEGSDVVIASRYQNGSRILGLTSIRKIFSRGAGLIFTIFKNIEGVKDYTCGFRAYRVSILKKAMSTYGDKFIEEQGFACMAEIILKLNKLNAIFHEVPMILRYDQKMGESKMNVLKTVKSTLKLVLKKL